MNIEIGNYLITSDKNNFIVSEKYEKRDGLGINAKLTGVFDYREVSYHGKIESALRKLLTLDLKGKSIDNIGSLLETIQRHRKELETVYGQFSDLLGGVAND